MPRSSSLASMLQASTLGLAALALAWMAYWWRTAPVRAIAGALLIWFGYGIVLAWQCCLLRIVSRDDLAVPRPTPAELARAWWAELWQAQRVFCWRQPFRWRAVPDQLAADRGRRGFVFIHGFVCNRGLWTPWLQRLQAARRAYVAVNLEPVFGPVDGYAPIVERAVREVTDATGLPPILVCHSMGGLAARAWLRHAGNAARVHHVVTIGTPHRGTWLGRFSHLANGRQMRLESAWLQELAASEASRVLPPFTCWYSHCDHIVFPTSSGMLPGADNRLVRGPAHVELAFDAHVMEATLGLG